MATICAECSEFSISRLLVLQFQGILCPGFVSRLSRCPFNVGPNWRILSRSDSSIIVDRFDSEETVAMIAQAQNLTRTLSETLAEHPDIEAAALYGSVARGDVEAHSDIDVLVFCRRSRKLPIHDYLSTQLRHLGNRLSLVIYSEKEMQFLSKTKSLFLLHLSREANLLFDKD